MKTYKIFRFFFVSVAFYLLSFSGNRLYAQTSAPTTATITIDPYSGLPDKPAPIDAPFNLVLPIDSNFKATDIYQIHIYAGKFENIKGKRILNFIPNSDGTAKELYGIKHSDIASGAVKLRIAKTGKDFDQLTICIQPIEPGTYFTPVIQFNLDAATIKLLNDNNALRFKKDPNAKNVYFNKIYSQFLNTPLNFFNPKNGVSILPDAPDSADYTTFYNSMVFHELEKVIGSTTSEQSVQAKLDALRLACSNLKDVLTRLGCCRCEENPFLRDTNSLLISIHIINNFCDAANYQSNCVNVAKGLRSLTDLFTIGSIENCEETDFDKRSQNIKSSVAGIKSLNRLIDLLLILKNDSCGIPDATLEEDQKALHELQDAFALVIKDIDTYNKTITALYQSSDAGATHFKITKFFSTGDNYAIDIKTTAGNIIQPEVDFATMLPLGKNVESKPLIRPYWGINIGGPINKQTRLRRIPYRRARNYISMTIGFTAMPLAADNRVDIKDLFNNFSFMNGLSFRPNRLFRLSAGYVLYKEYVPTPFTSDGKVMAMPYISLNIDLDVWNYTNLGGKLF